jgi:hypothetical protein
VRTRHGRLIREITRRHRFEEAVQRLTKLADIDDPMPWQSPLSHDRWPANVRVRIWRLFGAADSDSRYPAGHENRH